MRDEQCAHRLNCVLPFSATQSEFGDANIVCISVYQIAILTRLQSSNFSASFQKPGFDHDSTNLDALILCFMDMASSPLTITLTMHKAGYSHPVAVDLGVETRRSGGLRLRSACSTGTAHHQIDRNS